MRTILGDRVDEPWRRSAARFVRATAFILCLLNFTLAEAQTATPSTGAGASPPPATVYVRDFELDAAKVKSDGGILPRGPLANLRPNLLSGQKDSAVRARELVDLMSNSLIADLTKAGLRARRLAPGEPTPTSGWLVHGIFTQVDQGNNARRAIIGFGAGQTDLRVVASVDDLSAGIPKPLYEEDAGAESRKLPGAAVLKMNPYAVAARLVMSRNDLEKNVRKAADKIASDLIARVKK